MKASIEDVAKKAGVSKGTVSRVINEKPGVNESTRQKVLKAVEALEYSYTGKRAQTKTIGVVTPDYGDKSEYLAFLFYCVMNSAIAAGYDVKMISHTLYNRYAGMHGDIARDKGIAGYITLGGFVKEPEAFAIADSGIPVVAINNAYSKPHERISSVRSNAATGVEQALLHLRKLGHARVGFIGMLSGSPFNKEITDSFHASCERLLFEHKEEWFFTCESNSCDYGEIFSHRIVEAGPLPYTALFINHPSLAMGVLRGLLRQGVRIPDDLSLVGVGMTLAYEYGYPGVSSIAQDLDRLAFVAVQHCDALIQNGNVNFEYSHIATNFIIRESCAKIAAAKTTA